MRLKPLLPPGSRLLQAQQAPRQEPGDGGEGPESTNPAEAGAAAAAAAAGPPPPPPEVKQPPEPSPVSPGEAFLTKFYQQIQYNKNKNGHCLKDCE